MSSAVDRPIIGVLLDYENEGSFSSRPHYALRLAYFEAIEKAGGLPVALPYLPNSMDTYLDTVNGVVLPGGFYPYPAACYGETPEPDEPVHPRVAFEMDFTGRILSRDIPLLGICAGMQTMAAVLGATMYRDVHTAFETSIDHLNEKPAEEYAHPVSIVHGTLLHRVTGLEEMQVNTAHREGLNLSSDDDGIDGLVINAHAPDGVIEGLEILSNRYAIGVQWHPEFFLDSGSPHLALFEGLVTASAGEFLTDTMNIDPSGQVA